MFFNSSGISVCWFLDKLFLSKIWFHLCDLIYKIYCTDTNAVKEANRVIKVELEIRDNEILTIKSQDRLSTDAIASLSDQILKLQKEIHILKSRSELIPSTTIIYFLNCPFHYISVRGFLSFGCSLSWSYVGRYRHLIFHLS